MSAQKVSTNVPDCEQLTLFPVDSPASRLALPGSDEAKRMTATSGRRCLELSQSLGPLGQLERMLLVSYPWASTTRYLTWKVSATKQERLLFRLQVSGRGTEEIACSLLPTPKATDATHGGPNQRDSRGNYALPGAVHHREMWATPNAADAIGSHGGGQGRSLRTDIYNLKRNLFATPRVRDYRTGQAERWDNPARSRNLNDQVGGKLSVIFVEWLMGYPAGWTDLKDSETP